MEVKEKLMNLNDRKQELVFKIDYSKSKIIKSEKHSESLMDLLLKTVTIMSIPNLNFELKNRSHFKTLYSINDTIYDYLKHLKMNDLNNSDVKILLKIKFSLAHFQQFLQKQNSFQTFKSNDNRLNVVILDNESDKPISSQISKEINFLNDSYNEFDRDHNNEHTITADLKNDSLEFNNVSFLNKNFSQNFDNKNFVKDNNNNYSNYNDIIKCQHNIKSSKIMITLVNTIIKCNQFFTSNFNQIENRLMRLIQSLIEKNSLQNKTILKITDEKQSIQSIMNQLVVELQHFDKTKTTLKNMTNEIDVLKKENKKLIEKNLENETTIEEYKAESNFQREIKKNLENDLIKIEESIKFDRKSGLVNDSVFLIKKNESTFKLNVIEENDEFDCMSQRSSMNNLLLTNNRNSMSSLLDKPKRDLSVNPCYSFINQNGNDCNAKVDNIQLLSKGIQTLVIDNCDKSNASEAKTGGVNKDNDVKSRNKSVSGKKGIFSYDNVIKNIENNKKDDELSIKATRISERIKSFGITNDGYPSPLLNGFCQKTQSDQHNSDKKNSENSNAKKSKLNEISCKKLKSIIDKIASHEFLINSLISKITEKERNLKTKLNDFVISDMGKLQKQIEIFKTPIPKICIPNLSKEIWNRDISIDKSNINNGILIMGFPNLSKEMLKRDISVDKSTKSPINTNQGFGNRISYKSINKMESNVNRVIKNRQSFHGNIESHDFAYRDSSLDFSNKFIQKNVKKSSILLETQQLKKSKQKQNPINPSQVLSHQLKSKVFKIQSKNHYDVNYKCQAETERKIDCTKTNHFQLNFNNIDDFKKLKNNSIFNNSKNNPNFNNSKFNTNFDHSKNQDNLKIFKDDQNCNNLKNIENNCYIIKNNNNFDKLTKNNFDNFNDINFGNLNNKDYLNLKNCDNAGQSLKQLENYFSDDFDCEYTHGESYNNALEFLNYTIELFNDNDFAVVNEYKRIVLLIKNKIINFFEKKSKIEKTNLFKQKKENNLNINRSKKSFVESDIKDFDVPRIHSDRFIKKNHVNHFELKNFKSILFKQTSGKKIETIQNLQNKQFDFQLSQNNHMDGQLSQLKHTNCPINQLKQTDDQLLLNNHTNNQLSQLKNTDGQLLQNNFTGVHLSQNKNSECQIPQHKQTDTSLLQNKHKDVQYNDEIIDGIYKSEKLMDEFFLNIRNTIDEYHNEFKSMNTETIRNQPKFANIKKKEFEKEHLLDYTESFKRINLLTKNLKNLMKIFMSFFKNYLTKDDQSQSNVFNLDRNIVKKQFKTKILINHIKISNLLILQLIRKNKELNSEINHNENYVSNQFQSALQLPSPIHKFNHNLCTQCQSALQLPSPINKFNHNLCTKCQSSLQFSSPLNNQTQFNFTQFFLKPDFNKKFEKKLDFENDAELSIYNEYNEEILSILNVSKNDSKFNSTHTIEKISDILKNVEKNLLFYIKELTLDVQLSDFECRRKLHRFFNEIDQLLIN